MKIITTEKLPIKMWLEEIEDGAMEQVKHLANLPFAFSHVVIMPDSHQGYGMPIGGVLATKDVIIPNAVGVDIGCGMCAVKTSLTEIDTDTLKKIMGEIRKQVPVGFSKHEEEQDGDLMPRLPGEVFEGNIAVVYREYENALRSLGTLGGGNHFIEIQKGSDGHIWIMIHSGSRNLGKQVADHYNKLAIELNKKWHSAVPEDWELAFLPVDSEEGQSYIREMNYCVEFALANRKSMMDRIKFIFEEQVVLREVVSDKKTWEEIIFDPIINIAHNYASKEKHCATCIDSLDSDNPLYESLLGDEKVSKVLDSLDGYHPFAHSCGGLLLLKGESVLRPSPLQVDALEQMSSSIYSLTQGHGQGYTQKKQPFFPCVCESSVQIDASYYSASNKFGLNFARLFGAEIKNHKQGKAQEVVSPDLSVESHRTCENKSDSSLAYMALSEKEYHRLDRVLGRIFGFDSYTLYHTIHSHLHKATDVWVHRKGATLAESDTVGIIPGSQGTASYIVRGKGNIQSFKSCSHGAGRKMGRKEAERTLNLEEEQKALDEKGILHSVRGVKDLDEAPGAYKSISEVMKNQEDLVEILVELRPLAVIKG